MGSSDSKRVLLVDDEEPIRVLFEMILSADFPDLKIDLACNGQEALDAFALRRHTVVLMDLHMPVMDGRAAFWAIRELCQGRDWQMPAFIFCTGFAPPGPFLRAVAEEGGQHCLLPKPVSSRDLVQAVRQRLGKANG